MTTIAPTAAASRKTAQTSLFMIVFSLACHWAIVPVAAWNQSLLFVIIAALAPMALANTLRAAGKLPAVAVGSASLTKSLINLAARTAVVTFLFWNHLWLIAVVALIIMSIYKTQIVIKK